MGLPVPTFLSDCSDQAKVVSNRQLSLTSYRKLINMSNSELACVYAALILADDDVTVTGEKIETILKAAGVEVEPYWPGLFAKALESCDLKTLITTVGSGVGSAPAAGAAPAAAGGAAPAAEEAPAKKEESEEEEDDDMGFGLFD